MDFEGTEFRGNEAKCGISIEVREVFVLKIRLLLVVQNKLELLN
jgi:hypothetical protein